MISDFNFSRFAAERVVPHPQFSNHKQEALFVASAVTGGHLFDSLLQLDRVLALSVIKEALAQAETFGATGIITNQDDKLLYNVAKELGLSDKDPDIVYKQSNGPHQFVRIDIQHLLQVLDSMPIKDAVTQRGRS